MNLTSGGENAMPGPVPLWVESQCRRAEVRGFLSPSFPGLRFPGSRFHGLEAEPGWTRFAV
jgi:hypothetical protein